MYNAIQDMADGGVKMGLPRQTATEFSAHSAMVNIHVNYKTVCCNLIYFRQQQR